MQDAGKNGVKGTQRFLKRIATVSFFNKDPQERLLQSKKAVFSVFI
jgi:hypothetical protein